MKNLHFRIFLFTIHTHKHIFRNDCGSAICISYSFSNSCLHYRLDFVCCFFFLSIMQFIEILFDYFQTLMRACITHSLDSTIYNGCVPAGPRFDFLVYVEMTYFCNISSLNLKPHISGFEMCMWFSKSAYAQIQKFQNNGLPLHRPKSDETNPHSFLRINNNRYSRLQRMQLHDFTAG